MKKVLIGLMALAFVAAFSMPAAAQSEVSFGGFVAFDTWYVDTDEPALDMDGDLFWDDGHYSDKDLIWTMESVTSRFNATFKRENFTGFVEIRPISASYFRHWNAEWNFGPGYLLIGQTWLPSFMPVSSSVGPSGNIGPSGCGSSPYAGDTGNCSARAPMIRLRFPFSVGQFTFAMIDPSTPANRRAASGLAEDDIKLSLPQLEGKIDLSFGPMSFGLMGGWKQFKESYRNMDGDLVPDQTDFKINSYILAANTKFTGGPFSVALAGWMGENPYEYGYFGNPGFPADNLTGWITPRAAIADVSGDGLLDTVYDTDAWGAYINFTFKLNDMLAFAAGGGKMKLDGDYGALSYDRESAHMFMNATITVAEGFTLTPEIGRFDWKNADAFNANTNTGLNQDMGDTTYYGMYWKIVF